MTRTRTRSKKQEVKKNSFGLVIAGSIRIFRKDKDIEVKGKAITISDCWTNFSKKNTTDEYVNIPMKVIFQRDLDIPEHNSVIEVENSFITVVGNDGYERLALMVMGWDYQDE